MLAWGEEDRDQKQTCKEQGVESENERRDGRHGRRKGREGERWDTVRGGLEMRKKDGGTERNKNM